MTGFLASVLSVAEAEVVVAAGADIVDLKDPASGALGALPLDTIAAAVARVAGRRPVSATVGDLPMQPDRVTDAAARTAATGVDFVKVGLFPGDDTAGCIAALGRRCAQHIRLVAVMFADRDPDFALLGELRAAGFVGAMLDTADKSGGGLRRHLSPVDLGRFVAGARAHGLIAGLAGSLGLDDIAPLLELAPDYLGFRGALTAAGRATALDRDAVRAVRAAIPPDAAQPWSSASSASAVAGAQHAAASRASGAPDSRSAKSA